MLSLTALLGIAPSSKKEERKGEISERTSTIVNDMHQKVNAEEPFSLVYIDVLRKNGQLMGDTKYICQLVGGKMVTPRNIGVIVPFGKTDLVYKKLEQLADAPFRSELGISRVSYAGPSEEQKDAVHYLLVEAQKYRTRRAYAGKQPESSTASEKSLECA